MLFKIFVCSKKQSALLKTKKKKSRHRSLKSIIVELDEFESSENLADLFAKG